MAHPAHTLPRSCGGGDGSYLGVVPFGKGRRLTRERRSAPPANVEEENCAYMICPEQLGSRIASRRRACGLTQGEIADHMGVSPQAVSKWERGLACPDMMTIDDLAALLNIGLEELLTGHTTRARSA